MVDASKIRKQDSLHFLDMLDMLDMHFSRYAFHFPDMHFPRHKHDLVLK